MSWGKRDDRAALYPAIMAVLAVPGYEDDDRIVNEMRGFIVGLYDQVAAHTTDYVVDWGTVRTIAGAARVVELVRLSVLLGLLEECLDVRGLKAVRMVDDPNFVHVRSKSEKDWELQQRNDTRNPTLAGPIRRRDGDNCRWCGVRVAWTGQKSPRSATLDHLNPGEPATFTTMVVACTAHNSGLKNLAGEDRPPLRDAPVRPLYGTSTVEYLAENGLIVLTDDVAAHMASKTIKRPYVRRDGEILVCGPTTVGERDDATGQRPAQADNAASASDRATRPGNAAPRPAQPHHPRTPSRQQSAARLNGVERVGSGRDGSGKHSRSSPNPAGTGHPPGAGTDHPQGQPRSRRRGRRGGTNR